MAALSGAALFVAAAAASAAVVSTTGGMVHVPPPASLMQDQLASFTEAFVFDELQDVTLTSPIPVDITEPGTYDDDTDLTNSGVLPAGIVVDSHLMHADKPGSGDEFANITGTVTFDNDIVGIQVLGATLNAGDGQLGLPTTWYPAAVQRQVNLAPTGDRLILQLDRRTVFIRFNVNAHVDQVRVITEGDDPDRGTDGCTPGYWKQAHHYDSWVGYTPNQSFESVFGRDAFSGDPTLDNVVGFDGDGLNALGRHSVAALLNAANPNVGYTYSVSEVISMYQAAFDSGKAEIEATKDLFDIANNGGCPLNLGLSQGAARRPEAGVQR